MSRSRQPKVLTILSLALVAALFAVLVVRLTESDPGSGFVSAIRAGSKPAAPPFDLPVIWPSAETWPAQLRPGVGRGKVSLSDLRGFPTVLNFWASWCTACGAEARQQARAARADRGKVVFVGLDVNDFGSDADRFLRRHQLDYVSLRARGSSVSVRQTVTRPATTAIAAIRLKIIIPVIVRSFDSLAGSLGGNQARLRKGSTAAKEPVRM